MTQATLFDTPARSYHNTVPLQGSQLRSAEQEAKAQEAEIYWIFQAHNQLTPWQCEARLNRLGRKWPITSIRRAITNLTKQGMLRKANMQITGPLGKKENVWQLV